MAKHTGGLRILESDEMQMFGKYKLEEGNYNFSFKT